MKGTHSGSLCKQNLEPWYRYLDIDAEYVAGISIGKGKAPFSQKGNINFVKTKLVKYNKKLVYFSCKKTTCLYIMYQETEDNSVHSSLYASVKALLGICSADKEILTPVHLYAHSKGILHL